MIQQEDGFRESADRRLQLSMVAAKRPVFGVGGKIE
jgi:hypothetical protein